MAHGNNDEGGDIFGMIIAIIAIIYTFISTFKAMYKKKEEPASHEEYEDEEEDVLEEIFHPTSKKEEVPEKPHALPPPLPVHHPEDLGRKIRPEEKFTFRSSIDSFKPKTAIDERQIRISLHGADEIVSEELQFAKREGPPVPKKEMAPIVKVVSSIQDKKMLLIATEIMQPPLALRKSKSLFW